MAAQKSGGANRFFFYRRWRMAGAGECAGVTVSTAPRQRERGEKSTRENRCARPRRHNAVTGQSRALDYVVGRMRDATSREVLTADEGVHRAG